ncbi:oligopeptide transporter 4-like [Gossypium australe]|uniref:Oligopeptide transporter 4-like n=1 Tax=Gossypium australe TaxID=47621 RepID=A0A5B6W835_9ROSI|nr:oligopeptide transporter 4-like [Gossypium australe]
MQDPPPLAVNIPCDNPLFCYADDNALGDPSAPQLHANVHIAWNGRTLRDYALPSLDMVQKSIVRPTITANNFEIKSAMIQMIQNNLQFRGTMTDHLNQHFKRFLQPCDTFKYSEALGSITTWDKLVGKFLQKFFPISKAVQLRREIAVEGESLNELWERFKTLIQKCQHNEFPEWIRLQIFYNGLDANARSGLDGATAGALMNSMYKDAYKFIENMELNSCQ